MASPPVCVLCRTRPVSERFRPFCSDRCKTLDLAAWADGTYRVPGDDAPQSVEPPEPPEPVPPSR